MNRNVLHSKHSLYIKVYLEADSKTNFIDIFPVMTQNPFFEEGSFFENEKQNAEYDIIWFEINVRIIEDCSKLSYVLAC